MKPSIRDDVKELRRVDLEDLVPMQGALKELSVENFEKLKRSILDRGFSAPIIAWDDDGVLKVSDGHQRLRVMKKLKEDGHKIPLLPVAVIHAQNEDDFRGKLLSMASQFGEVTKDGLYEIINEWELDPSVIDSDFRFPEIEMSEFKEEFFDESDSNKKDSEQKDLETMECPNCGVVIPK